jgi:hypothetical protein
MRHNGRLPSPEADIGAKLHLGQSTRFTERSQSSGTNGEEFGNAGIRDIFERRFDVERLQVVSELLGLRRQWVIHRVGHFWRAPEAEA